uniref:Uncharacterized protein n=1 Tax=Parascaris univalens TaxID=6257 RepID=A0A915BEH4_PARUN
MQTAFVTMQKVMEPLQQNRHRKVLLRPHFVLVGLEVEVEVEEEQELQLRLPHNRQVVAVAAVEAVLVPVVVLDSNTCNMGRCMPKVG